MTEIQQKIEYLQNMLVDLATGGEGQNEEYIKLRAELIANQELKKYLPNFLTTARNTGQFWQFIKLKFKTYAERRTFLWEEFSVILNYLESRESNVIEESTTKTLEKFNIEYINSQWLKSLERKSDDPEGAITSARTLIETTCKFILDDLSVKYEDDLDLPKLYKLTATQLNLAPDQHTEQIFKQILGGCQSVVESLGALRNKLSDSHGKKISQNKPSARHAELAVNLAGTMTTFLLETYESKLQKI